MFVRIISERSNLSKYFKNRVQEKALFYEQQIKDILEQKNKMTTFSSIGALNSPKIEDDKNSSFCDLRIQTADLDERKDNRNKTDRIMKKIERNKFIE